jgi:superfamily II DNA or RNA helicase
MERDEKIKDLKINVLEELVENNKENESLLRTILNELSFRKPKLRVRLLKERIIFHLQNISYDFEFTNHDFGIKITSYTGDSDFVTVPRKIDGKLVVSIGENAFFGKNVVQVGLPDSIKWLASSAFANCSKLRTLKIPQSVIEIGDGCFDGCTKLDLTLPYKWIPQSFVSREEVIEPPPPPGPTSPNPPDPPVVESIVNLELYDWQTEALDCWKENGYRGIVEAVTGAGKTHVALQAMLDHLHSGYKVVVIVPTITLLNQWFKKVMDTLDSFNLSEYVVDKMGDGNQGARDCDVLIAVCNSASSKTLLESGKKGLLIADECHRYGTEQWSYALEGGFAHRLGLTATLERQDEGIDEFIKPYFHKVVYTLGYERALEDEIISDFKIALLGVDFDDNEREQYEASDSECSRLKSKLVKQYGVTSAPFGQFIKEVVILSGGSFLAQDTRLARKYIKEFTARKKLITSSQGKINALKHLTESIDNATGTIVFTETIEAARKAKNLLMSNGINAEVIDSSMSRSEREYILRKFAQHEIQCIISPRILDEGIDVPEADLAVIMSASKSKRQMIQRMGRVIRKKADGRLARVVFMFMKDTLEDPIRETNFAKSDTFIDVVEDVAWDTQNFEIGDENIIDYLNYYEM